MYNILIARFTTSGTIYTLISNLSLNAINTIAGLAPAISMWICFSVLHASDQILRKVLMLNNTNYYLT